MNRRTISLGGLLMALAFFALAPRADALITRKAPLAGFIAEVTFIFTAKIDSVDGDKLQMVLTPDEHLKGKFAFPRLPINLKGDKESDKLKHQPLLLKRVAPKLPVVVFVTKDKDKEEYAALVYTNGTWFQMLGEKPDGADTVRWSYTHLEPYLRKTYTGTTAEMKQTLADAMSGKKKAPAVNDKEEPGVGPEVEPKKPAKKKDGAAVPLATGPVFGVIPAVMIGGPLAILAMLFPSVFGGWKRWLSLISVTCTTSTLYFLHSWFSPNHPDAWWSGITVYWIGMTLVTAVGGFWAWQRHLHRVTYGEAPLAPGNIELFILLGVSTFAVLFVVGYVVIAVGFTPLWDGLLHDTRHFSGQFMKPLLALDGLPVIVFCVGIWSGTIYDAAVKMQRRHLPALAVEVVMLAAMTMVSTGLLLACSTTKREPTAGGSETAWTAHQVWEFKLPDKGGVASSPLLAEKRVYIAAEYDSLIRPYGTLYCLDRATGEQVWAFNNGKERMKQAFSTPVLANGKIYIGEGLHTDSACRLFCLKAATGEKVWDFQTSSHTESTPCVVDGKVYCGAGDDGLYCLDAETGTKIWNFPGLHVDAGPVVANGRVYCGAGIGDVFKDTQFFCLDARDGSVKWRVPTEQPVWGAAVCDGERVYFGIGNGRINERNPNPSGSLVCLNAKDGGDVWRLKLHDSMLCKPVFFGGYIYFGSCDGRFYCVQGKTGKVRWEQQLTSPIVAAAALAREAGEGPSYNVYVPCSEGKFYSLSADTGHIRWQTDLGEGLSDDVTVQLFSSPSVEEVRRDGEARLRVYFGMTLETTARAGSLRCFEEVSKKDKE